MYTIVSNIWSRITKSERNSNEKNQICRKTFSTLPVINFRKGTNLKQIIGTNTIYNNENLIKTRNNHYSGKRVPLNPKSCFCFQKLISTTTFKRNQTNKAFKIYHKVNCKTSFDIYLLECYICKIQYPDKSKTPFKIRFNNDGKDLKNLTQYQLANTSTSTIMILTVTEKSLS